MECSKGVQALHEFFIFKRPGPYDTIRVSNKTEFVNKLIGDRFFQFLNKIENICAVESKFDLEEYL